MLGFDLTPQGENIARVILARDNGLPLYDPITILLPRRSAKTTSIWSVLLGLCATVPGFRVAATAQDGTRAAQKMREMMRALEANGLEEDGTLVLEWSNGREALRFANGSRFWTLKPAAAAFRSEAADILLFDEAGELDIEKSADLLAGALPLTDTRTLGQAIIAGTPAKARAGLFWDKLNEARGGDEGCGIVDYSVRDDEALITYDDEGEPHLDEDLLCRVHPGIGTLTTLVKIRKRLKDLGPALFEREYGCVFPRSNVQNALNIDAWIIGLQADLIRPDRVGIAYDVRRDGTSASIVYAWRLEDGTPCVELVAHRAGTPWLPGAVYTAALPYKRVAIAYDNIGANMDPAQALSRMKPVPKTDPLSMREISAAAQRFAAAVHSAQGVHHLDQSDLDNAIENASWRPAGTGQAFGMRDSSAAPINPVVAASLALWSYDKGKDRAAIGIVA